MNISSVEEGVEEGDDVAILVVGGNGGTGKEAELLTSRPRRTGEGSSYIQCRGEGLITLECFD